VPLLIHLQLPAPREIPEPLELLAALQTRPHTMP
jgi:hypothetical protein